jgi:hypothetical protein
MAVLGISGGVQIIMQARSELVPNRRGYMVAAE